jgi:5-methyltetrahydropteroyltriglutamate--homocysteine methyltransferase
MRRSRDRIITTHVGSLSRPAELLTLNKARAGGGADVAAYATGLAAAVTDVVNKQRDVGIDIPNDGEFGKPMSAAYDYGAWWNYAFERLDGFAAPDSILESEHKKSTVAELSLTSFARRRDWQKFNEFYQDPMSGLAGSAPVRRTRRPVCTGPIRYKGHAQTQADIANLKSAMAAAGIEEGFMTSVAPGSFARGEDLHYESEEEFVVATAGAMREEYRAIVDAGLVLQIDDPSLPDNWDMIDPEPPRFADCPKIAFVITSAGAAGTGRTRLTSHSPTLSTSCSPFARKPTRSRRAMSAMSTNGVCGRK